MTEVQKKEQEQKEEEAKEVEEVEAEVTSTEIEEVCKNLESKILEEVGSEKSKAGEDKVMEKFVYIKLSKILCCRNKYK